MPKNLKPDYQCARCGYATRIKSNIKKHLYNVVKDCPVVLNDIELTDDVKEYILKNRVYRVQTNKTNQTNQIINNYNILCNYIGNIDNKIKLEHLLQYYGRNMIGFGDTVESKHKQIINRLDNDSYKYGFELDHHQMLSVIDQSTQMSNDKFEEINVLFNEKLNKILMYHDDQWDIHLMERGLQEIIRILRDYYLESYEKHIYRKLHMDTNINAFDRNTYQVRLREYYKFLACFEVYPFVYQKENGDVLKDFSHNNEHYLEEMGMKIYKEIKDGLNKVEINKMRKTVVDMIKKNTQYNVQNLNKNILKIVNIDEDFKNTLLKESYV